MRAAEEAVEDARAILNDAGLDSTGAVTVGDPRTGILDEAGHWSARLIVVGSHGITEADRVAPGSVAETVALHAHCSVEVIRAA
jgi:nucleotide-binding universal stress UspA family protein